MVVASRSNALAVIPTVVPTVTFSSTWFVAAFVSVGVVTLNSSRSLMVILNVCEADEPSLDWANTVTDRDAPTSHDQ